MSLKPTPSETLARARSDLALGLPVVVQATGGDVVILAAEVATAERFAHLNDGETVLAITHHRANTLKARAYDGDMARVELPADLTLQGLKDLAEPARDLAAPMKGPLKTQRGGDPGAHRAALTLAKSARLLPAVLVRPTTGIETTAFVHVDAQDISADPAPVLTRVVQARVPLSVSPDAQLHVFRADDGSDEHVGIVIGPLDADQPVLTRLHSACFTGDLLGSLKCDCGAQLRAALHAMGQEGRGILLYLNQEGRGIGLTNKMRAYSLQDQGFDTVDANHRLGFEDDERDFRLGAAMLEKLGVRNVRLMTNNPGKVAMLEKCGLTVSERVPLVVGQTDENAEYLATKAARSGHLL